MLNSLVQIQQFLREFGRVAQVTNPINWKTKSEFVKTCCILRLKRRCNDGRKIHPSMENVNAKNQTSISGISAESSTSLVWIAQERFSGEAFGV